MLLFYKKFAKIGYEHFVKTIERSIIKYYNVYCENLFINVINSRYTNGNF